jgi:glycosyltransferase involved in cell wall biosynthesis
MNRTPKISLCMIVRNEEDFLADCLRSVRDVVDEIIVVDTGSTDSTPAIADGFGARVFEHRWKDDFSEARNRSLDHATGDWILVLDADETIAHRDINKIRSLAGGTADGYILTYRGYSRESNDIRWIANDGAYREGDGWDGYLTGRVVRMFKRDDRIRFRGVVHESVDPSIRSFGGTLAETDIIIHHFHERKGESKVHEKQLHYLRLCEKNLERYPHNAKSHFDMGLICRYVLDDAASAIPHLMRAVQLDPRFEEARMALAFAHHLNGDRKAAAAELTTLLQYNPAGAAPLWYNVRAARQNRARNRVL